MKNIIDIFKSIFAHNSNGIHKKQYNFPFNCHKILMVDLLSAGNSFRIKNGDTLSIVVTGTRDEINSVTIKENDLDISLQHQGDPEMSSMCFNDKVINYDPSYSGNGFELFGKVASGFKSKYASISTLDIEITLPEDSIVQLNVYSVFSNIQIQNISEANIRLNTSSDIEVGTVNNAIIEMLSSGSIRLQKCERLYAKLSSSGQLHVHEVTGASQLNILSSGSIHIDNMEKKPCICMLSGEGGIQIDQILGQSERPELQSDHKADGNVFLTYGNMIIQRKNRNSSVIVQGQELKA